ncbi:MAG TPA: DUF1826 domain-containing protein [Polyangiales bacterium]|nr:DUF1826 domain-containing protein [Polyangiales bacterium]
MTVAPRNDFAIAPDPEVLDAIRQRGLHFAVWRRRLDATVTQALEPWTARASLEVDAIVRGDRSVDRVVSELATLPASAWMTADVARLLARFRAVSGASDVRLTLAVRRTDACRKFHADFVRLRLITTYVGPGTEWVPAHAIRREILAAPPECPREANRRIVRDRRAIRHARAGDVLLLKGEHYEGAPGAVHRSPPIVERGLARLVLTLSTCT